MRSFTSTWFHPSFPPRKFEMKRKRSGSIGRMRKKEPFIILERDMEPSSGSASVFQMNKLI